MEQIWKQTETAIGLSSWAWVMERVGSGRNGSRKWIYHKTWFCWQKKNHFPNSFFLYRSLPSLKQHSAAANPFFFDLEHVTHNTVTNTYRQTQSQILLPNRSSQQQHDIQTQKQTQKKTDKTVIDRIIRFYSKLGFNARTETISCEKLKKPVQITYHKEIQTQIQLIKRKW